MTTRLHKNIVVAGGRNLKDPDSSYLSLVVGLLIVYDAGLVISGGCDGADKIGEDAARILGLPVRVVRADWDSYKKSAGPIRNAAMAKMADLVICLPGGIGTDSMRREARKAGIKCLSVSVQTVYDDNLPSE